MMLLSVNSWAQNPPMTQLNLDLNSPEIKHEVRDRFLDLSVCNQNLTTTTDAYDDCISSNHPIIEFWQTPEVVIGGFVVTVSVTATVICLTHTFGACK